MTDGNFQSTAALKREFCSTQTPTSSPCTYWLVRTPRISSCRSWWRRAAREVRDHRSAVHLQMGNRRVSWGRLGGGEFVGHVGDCGTHPDDEVVIGGTPAVSARMRDGVFAKVAMNAVRVSRSWCSNTCGAQDRRADARILERTHHRDDRTPWSSCSLCPRLSNSIVVVLLYQFDWRYVVVILLTMVCYTVFLGHELAPSAFAAAERQRYRCQRQGHQFAVELRETHRLRRGGTGGQALRSLDGVLRVASVEAYVSLAVPRQATIFTIGLAIGGDVRLRYSPKILVGQFVMMQHNEVSSLPTAEFHGDGLSRSSRRSDRYRNDVRRFWGELEDKPHGAPLYGPVDGAFVTFENVTSRMIPRTARA